jgi:hypothetical protein
MSKQTVHFILYLIIIWLKPIPFFYIKNGLKPNPIDFIYLLLYQLSPLLFQLPSLLFQLPPALAGGE